MTGSVSRRSSAFPRAGFNNAELVRVLAELDLADAAGTVESKQELAERLGLWLDWTAAIPLLAALGAGHADTQADVQADTQADGQLAPQSHAKAAAEEFTRVRSALVRSITTDDLLSTDKAGMKVPPSKAGAAVEPATDFAPFRRRHVAHQRAMAAGVESLRGKVREVLAGMSPALARLAALDAAMGAALAARERQLLAAVPALLERHFERLGRVHPQAHPQVHPQAPADPSPQPAAWLAVFCGDMRAVLLAELDLRLLPVEGMIEAIRSEASSRQ